VILGFSMGAYRALDAVVNGGLDARALVLAGGFADLAAPHRDALVQLAAAVRVGLDMRQALEEAWFSPGFRSEHPEVVAGEYDRVLSSAPREVIARDIEAGATTPPLLAELSRITVPVMLLVGTADLSTPPAYAHQMSAALQHAIVVLVEGAGHALHYECPDRIVAAVEHVLAK